MFDLAWSEIALIGVVALLVIGPKDLPGAIRGVAQMLGKARRMAGEFQGHVDEMVREAKLDEVKREIDQFKTNVQNEVYKATSVDDLKRDIVDPLQSTVSDLQRPFDAAAPPPPPPPAPAPTPLEPAAAPDQVAAATEPVTPLPPAPPAFIPPALSQPGASRA